MLCARRLALMVLPKERTRTRRRRRAESPRNTNRKHTMAKGMKNATAKKSGKATSQSNATAGTRMKAQCNAAAASKPQGATAKRVSKPNRGRPKKSTAFMA